MSEQTDILEYLSKEENRKQAFMLSMQFYQVSHNWFTSKQISKKCKGENEESIRIKLLALISLGMCRHKQDDKGVEKFKIILNVDDRIHFLEDRVGQLEKEKQLAILEIERLKKEKHEKDNNTKEGRES